MPRVIYITADGAERAVEASEGVSAMTGAVHNAVPGILGDCGGACSCATCHVTVDEAWRDRVGPPAPEERELLSALDEAGPGSRLACQIALRAELDGLVLRIPAAQG